MGATEANEYCKKELLAMGWTEGAIRRFLPHPIEEQRHSRQFGYYTVLLWAQATVHELRQTSEVQQYFDKLKARAERRQNRKLRELPLLDAIREVSRAAHRWRDAASAQYSAGNYGFASHSSGKKKNFYNLKERGIASAYKQGLLRYAGQTPQGMAVYEYGEGGLSCFHSCLHPVGVFRPLVVGHPETLFVVAKKQKSHVEDARNTLLALPEPGDDFERSASPAIRKNSSGSTCWECGGEGHISRNCPERDGGEEFVIECRAELI
jgi:hypothetical protein